MGLTNIYSRGKHVFIGAVFMLSLFLSFFSAATAEATPDPYLSGGSPITTVTNVASALADIRVSGTGNPTVPVKLRVVSGTLAMSTTTGLTFTGSPTGSTLQFSGTLTNVNAALATLTYTRNGTGTDTLEASLVNAGEVFFSDTGHLYEYVSYTSNWDNAKINAATRTKYGATGYLTTISSQAENDFVAARLANAGWMGASDSVSEGDWKWVAGPENGTSFWSGASGGSTVGGRYANWGTGEPNDAGNEDCAQFLTGGTGKWNDLPCSATTLPGYVVEYGSISSPIDVSSVNVSITTIAANTAPSTPTSLSGFVGGAWTTTNNPALTFSLSDTDVSDTLRYRVQIDDSSDFSSPVIDYTSGLAVQGSRTFTVGQAAGTGTYTTGFSGQSLSDGSYYWRVRGIDGATATSSYAVANSGAIAFKVDTTAPTVPGTPSTVDSSSDNTPTIAWTVSTDAGNGLHGSNPYSLEWAANASFTSAQSSVVGTNSLTIPTSLTDGTWYFRARSRDVLSNTSSYSPTFTFVVDTAGPTTPGTPMVTANGTRPKWDWAASTDSGVAGVTYLVEWASASDFSGTLNMLILTGNTYTHTADLADGTWYFRIKAIDGAGNASLYSAAGSVVISTPKPVVTTTVRTTTTTTTVESTPVTTIAAPSSGSSILLNTFETYTDGTGKQLQLQPQQKVYFTHKEEDHSATIKDIEENFVVVTVASTPTDVKVEKGKSVDHDVDGDGVADIRITYNGMKNGLADIIFTKLAPTTVAIAAAQTHSNRNLWFILIIIVAMLIGWYAYKQRHHEI